MTSGEETESESAEETWLTPSTADRGRVAKVVRCVQLSDIQLAWCLAIKRRDSSDIPDNWVRQSEPLFDATLDEESVTGEGFVAFSRFGMVWAGGGSEEEPDIELRAVFSLHYGLAKEGEEVPVDEEDLRHFCVFNAPFNAWPYWREYVQSTTARMGVRPYITEVLRVPGFSTK